MPTPVLIGLVAVAALVVGWLAYTLVSGGSDDETATDETPSTTVTIPTESTVVAPPLAAGAPATVPIEADTNDSPRVHPMTMTGGQTGTIVVTSDQRFTPQVALLTPEGTEVPMQGLALGRRGAAVAVSAPSAGEYSLLISGFSSVQTAYTVEFHADEAFLTPAQLAVGDCVNRLEGEDWRSVSGFFVIGCDQPHEGQVFEQVAGATESGQAAQERCDVARNEHILLPGFVNWFAYWGGDLTCILTSGTGAPLTGSLVSN